MQKKYYVNSKGKKFTGYLITAPQMKDTLSYILVVPDDMENGKQIIVESLNFEMSDNTIEIAENVIRELKDKVEIFDDAPYLIPFLPAVRGGRPYYQQLSRECFETSLNGEYTIGHYRVDLKVVATIKDAINLIQDEHNKTVDKKIFLNGYSSSGVFAQRFALLHPELVDRAMIGGAAGTIPIPNEELEYPLGIKDYKELFGKDFDMKSYKNIEFAYYVAEFETNKPAWEFDINGHKLQRDQNGNKVDNSQVAPPMHDMSYHLRSTPLEIGKKQRKILGEGLDKRFKNSVEYYEGNGYKICSKIYKCSSHSDIFLANQGAFRHIMEKYYKENKPFEYDGYSADEISMKEQRKREGKTKGDDDIDI